MFKDSSWLLMYVVTSSLSWVVYKKSNSLRRDFCSETSASTCISTFLSFFYCLWTMSIILGSICCTITCCFCGSSLSVPKNLFIPLMANTAFFSGARVWLALTDASGDSIDCYCVSAGSELVGCCDGLRKGDDLFLILVYFSNLRVELTAGVGESGL